MSADAGTTDPEFDRDEFRDVVRRLLDEVSGSTTVHALADSGQDGDDGAWKQMVGMGLTALEIPEVLGGIGAGFDATSVVLIELGRHLVTSALSSTIVLAVGGLLGCERPAAARWLPLVADGSARGSAALHGESGQPSRPDSLPRATRDGDGWRVSGVWGYVPDAATADVLVLRAETDDGPLLAAVATASADLQVRPVPMMDLTRRFSRVEARQLSLGAHDVIAVGDGAAAVVGRLADRAALATACDSLGVAERAFDMTLAHLKNRVQFQRTIGSFQALKHQATDLLIAVETTRISVDRAVASLARGGGSASTDVSMAKSHSTNAAADVAAAAVTMHGGIGYTWEHDCHLMLKRAKLNQALDGDTRWHRRRVADAVFG